MIFEYDSEKSRENRKKHGISLEEAKLLWETESIQIPAKNMNEARSMMIGKLEGKFYSCIFTMRGDRIRLISARRTRKNEEEIYHEKIGKNA